MTFLDFLPKKLGGFVGICRKASLFSFSRIFGYAVSFTADLFTCFASEGVLATKVACGVCGPFTRFVRTSRVVFADWMLAIASTFFLPQRWSFRVWKDFEGTFTIWPVTSTL